MLLLQVLVISNMTNGIKIASKMGVALLARYTVYTVHTIHTVYAVYTLNPLYTDQTVACMPIYIVQEG